MDKRGFKDELQKLLIKYDLIQPHLVKLTIVCNTTPEGKIGSVKIAPEFEIR
jgi:hypothetical protein